MTDDDILNDELLKNEANLNVDDILKETNFDPKEFDMKNLDFLTQQVLEYEEGLDTGGEASLSHVDIINEHFNAMLNMQGIHETKAEKKDTLHLFKNPIDFVHYMETVYIKKHLETHENVFHLRNYKCSKNKVNVLQFIPKSTLSSRIFRGGNVITSINAYGEMLFSGNNLGIIKKYSCETEYEHETFSNPELEISNTRSVVCMDIFDQGQFLISGYSNGYLALWDIQTAKCKKVIKEVHKDCVLACCIVRAENKTYEILSSDLQGFVYNTVISEGFFNTSADPSQIIKTTIPIFLIEVLKYSKEQKKKYPFAHSEVLVVAFGCLENIVIYQLEPEMKRLFVFERPKHKTIYFVPDISFGIGYAPKPNTEEEENNSGVDFYQPYTLLTISWDNIVHVYIVPVTPQEALPLIPAGHYINNVPILRLGFLSPSIVYLFDKNKSIKIINTSLINYGLINSDSIPQIPNQTSKNPVLEENIVQETDILFQTNVPDIIEKKEGEQKDKRIRTEISAKATYNQYIRSQSKILFLLGKRQFHYGRLLNWEQCINNLQQNSESMIAMSLGLDLFHGRVLSLPDIPINEFERKKKVENILKGLIIQYALINTSHEPSSINDKPDEHIIKCINICIEFCLELQNVDLLFTELLPMFDCKNYGNIFIEKLEPFILNNKIGHQQLGSDIIAKLIDIYKNKNNLQLLSQILSHLDIESVDVDDIKKLCIDNHLITALIYIYMNGSQEDFFFPITSIYDYFSKSNDVPQSDFGSYSDYLKNAGVTQLEQSKPYIGHKLLWYINLCLNGEKYPSKSLMQEGKHQSLLLNIILWLITPEVFNTLIHFDSFSLFYLFTRIFHEKKLIALLDKCEFDAELCKGATLSNTPIDNFNKLTLCEIIIEQTRKINNDMILEDFFEFISKVSITIKGINKDIIIKASSFLLNIKRKETDKEIDDYFGMHTKSYDQSNYIATFSNLIILMIDSREDMTNEDYETILLDSKLSPFVNVTLHLLNKVQKYSECLIMFIEDKRIENKIERAFIWLNETLAHLHSINQKAFDSLKEKVNEKIFELGELSIEKFSGLITKWFNAKHNNVIDKLKGNDKLQLLYVDRILDNFKEDELQPEEQKSYENLLTIHMELLFKLNKHDLIYQNLQKRQMYQTDALLEKCKLNKVYDAALFLFKKIGAIEEAMEFFFEVLQKTFDNIIFAIQSNEANAKVESLLNQHRENLNRCIEICEINSDKSTHEEAEEMWFKLLRLFYNMLNKIKASQSSGIKKLFDELTVTISKNIKELLEKMDSYVRIQKIIENVTDNYKQAEFKEFKNLLLDVLSSYSYIKNILYYATQLLGNSLTDIVQEYNDIIVKGNHYDLQSCDVCKEGFDRDGKDKGYLFVFRCGHKVHDSCAYLLNNKMIMCPECRNTEERNKLVTKIDTNSFENIFFPSLIQKPRKQVIQKESSEQRKIFDDLKNIDKQFYSISKIFDIED